MKTSNLFELSYLGCSLSQMNTELMLLSLPLFQENNLQPLRIPSNVIL